MGKRLARLPILMLVLLAGCAFPPSAYTKTPAQATATAVQKDPCAFVVPTLTDIPKSAIHPAPTVPASSAVPTPAALQGPISQAIGAAAGGGSSFLAFGGNMFFPFGPSLAFTSPDDGWIVGTIHKPLASGAVSSTPVSFHVVNGGVKRVPVQVHDHSDVNALSDIVMTSPTEGWAIADFQGGSTGPLIDGSTIVHLDNGTWTEALALGALPLMGNDNGGGVLHHGYGYFTDIAMVSPDEGWAVGVSGERTPIIAHYANGSWKESLVADEIGAGFIHHISMADADHGIGIGGNSTFMFGGGTWNLLNYEQGAWTIATSGKIAWTGAQMLSPTLGWATGQRVTGSSTPTASDALPNAVAHYCNGRWNIAYTDLPMGRLEMVSQNEGWLGIAGYVDSSDSADVNSIAAGMMHYLNGKWTYTRVAASCGGVEKVDMLSAQQGWALCYDGQLLRYQGKQWSPA